MNKQAVITGSMSALMACTGGAVLLIHGANEAGLSSVQLMSWLFAVYVFGGAMSLLFSLKYKVPMGGAHSITGAALLTTAMAPFSIHELAGSFMLSGALIALLGFTGLFAKILDWVPRPLIDAMLAGIVLKYAVSIIPSVKELPLAGGLALLGFLVVPKFIKGMTPLLGAVLLGTAGLLAGYDFPVMAETHFSLPQMVTPAFTLEGFLSISIPLAVLVLSNDLAIAMSALKKNEYHTPVNSSLIWTGMGTAFVSLFGGHSINPGGMMTTLCSSDEAGPRNSRYAAGVVSGVLVMLFGIFAWKTSQIIQALPSAFIAMISGFTLLGVLLTSLQSAFSAEKYRFSILFTFIISIANVSFLGISSPVLALAAGGMIAKILKEGAAVPARSNT